MQCAELASLRHEATAVFKELFLRQCRSREYAAANARGGTPSRVFARRGDFEVYLQRRLAKSAARIESHIATHGCQA
jgi:hypothetical protein